jgi:ppGpp synthetase/RelA/SpoT-type nucleotidyltranferase
MDIVRRSLETRYSFEVTFRHKQLRSVVEKLKRSQIRLSGMQDLVGFRVVLGSPGEDVGNQQEILDNISTWPFWRIAESPHQSFARISSNSLDPQY